MSTPVRVDGSLSTYCNLILQRRPSSMSITTVFNDVSLAIFMLNCITMEVQYVAFFLGFEIGFWSWFWWDFGVSSRSPKLVFGYEIDPGGRSDEWEFFSLHKSYLWDTLIITDPLFVWRPIQARLYFNLWCDFEADTGFLQIFLILDLFLCKLIEITLYCFNFSQLDYYTMSTTIAYIGEHRSRLI